MAMGAVNASLRQIKKERKEDIVIPTKAGRRLEKQSVEGYTRENLTAWIDRSRKNLGTDCLDLVQLHCAADGSLLRARGCFAQLLDDFVACREEFASTA